MRKEGESFTQAVVDLAKHYDHPREWVIKNLLEAEKDHE